MFRSDQSCWDCLEPHCPPFDVDSEYFWAVLVLVLLLMVLDVSYYTRICWDQVVTRLRRGCTPPPVLTPHTYHGICLSTSLDASYSLNKAAGFLRECQFALRAFYVSSYISSAARSLGVTLGEGSNNVKLRKPLSFMQAYFIQTRIVWWDDQSLYLEQKLIRTLDMEVCAINFSRQMVVGASPQQMLDLLPVCSCKPDVPPEIASWMVCIKIVNRELHGCCQ